MIPNPKCAHPGASPIKHRLSGSSVRANKAYNSGKRKKRHMQHRGRARGGHLSLQKKTISSAVTESLQQIPDRLQERLGELNTEERQKIAKLTGYRQIGEPLPEEISILDVIRTFPPEVYELHHWKAWCALATTISAIVLGYTCTAIAPWFLLPLTWFFTGTAATGLFVLGHDCGHYVFHSARWVNDLVGNIVMTPLIYPYEPWKIMHNLHHVHTNKLDKDTGWHPVLADRFEEGSAGYTAVKAVLGSPLKLWLSVAHWIKLHFSPDHFTSNQMFKVTVSWIACFTFALSVWSVLILKFGLGGLVKFWLMPWLVYHFWMSTFTLVHHTAPHIPFQRQEDYNGARAKLGGTVHCDFPRWVEFLCHDINVHIPHHVSARIPFYNLRAATESLRKNWGQYMTECSFNWRMMRNFFTEIHLYNVGKEYVAFDSGKKEDPLLAVQRQLLPDIM